VRTGGAAEEVQLVALLHSARRQLGESGLRQPETGAERTPLPSRNDRGHEGPPRGWQRPRHADKCYDSASLQALATYSRRCYFLTCDEALSKALFIAAHAESIPDCMCCHADSLAARISCNFLWAASRWARIALICSAYLALASALNCSPLTS